MIYISFFVTFIGLVIPLINSFSHENLARTNYLLKCLLNLLITMGGIILIFKYVYKLPLYSSTASPFDFKFTMKFLIAGVIIEVILGLLEHFFHIFRIFEIKAIRAIRPRTFVKASLFSLLVFIGVFLYLSSYWATDIFGELYPRGILYPEQIIYNLTQPMEGADQQFFLSFLSGPLLKSIMSLFVSFPILLIMLNSTFSGPFSKKVVSRASIGITSILSIILIVLAGINIDAVGFYRYFTSSSDFIEKNYVSPNQTKISFPKKKRNLIYIYVESLESSNIDKLEGGQLSENLLPGLTNLAKEGINFSDTNKQVGGAHQFSGTGWTIAGMVAQTAGLPLKVPTAENNYGQSSKNKFLPGATTLNDILEKEGYQQTILMGSDATFGGRRAYFSQHGDVKIDDYLTAKKDKRIPKDYHVWWGYEDSKLFDFAQDDLTTLSASDKPFNLTMLTANMHFPDGYPEKKMPQKYGEQYANVINYNDTQIVDFVNWVKKQPFYDNTTIIIHGDHLSMDQDFYTSQNVPVDKRRTFNLILNAPIKNKNINDKQRMFGTFDMFPTTLAAIGAKIDGDRLGLGTNLFSNKATIPEKYGFDKVNDELALTSKFYNDKFILNKK
ncbi:LTA synthase family protein [Lapidilactobacillus wuchangensis]|uniref:LTA synthase family protein n=1 Tax=Lapidilactobacillus wuchangensis TaxID=2486001 RepID=UPI000F7A3D1E|nr:LTA synthase family protein [Lapidilactobacillus wuchangensis]